MKSAFSFVLFFFSVLVLRAQGTYWQQDLKYKISVSLNEPAKELSGSERIVYKNNAPRALDYIWFHIWPNAYDKSKNTALYAQLRRDKGHRRKLNAYDTGFITDLDFHVNGKKADTEAHSSYIDIIKVKLPEPLKSGDSAIIETPFRVKLPNFFSRSGYTKDQFMICQWYPKPAVYDKDGWHEFPYLDMGEFYSEYASYNVDITLPSSYIVGATGTLQTGSELKKYREIGSANYRNRNYAPLRYQADPSAASKTLSYKADSVPDFAWFASKDFVIHYDTLALNSGKKVDVFTFFSPKGNNLWTSGLDYVKDATRKYSSWIGDYAYPTVQAVQGPSNINSGGMEYPMITLITSDDKKALSLDGVIAHEVGHNWFMSMIGSNEREHPWLDEGLNTYFELRYEAEKYRYNSVFGDNVPAYLKKMSAEDFQSNTYGVIATLDMKAPMESPAGFRNNDEYAMSSYIKPALWIFRLQQTVGPERINKAFRHYFQQWKFKHPGPSDLKTSLEESLGFSIDAWFNQIYQSGGL